MIEFELAETVFVRDVEEMDTRNFGDDECAVRCSSINGRVGLKFELTDTAILGDRKFEFETYSSIYRTASNGTFVIPEIPGVHLLYVAHEDGFCEFKLDHPQSPLSIHLLPWGRLEGVATLEGKPAPHEKIALLRGTFLPGVRQLSLSPTAFQ